MADIFPPVLAPESTVLPPTAGLEGQVFVPVVPSLSHVYFVNVFSGNVFPHTVFSDSFVYTPHLPVIGQTDVTPIPSSSWMFAPTVLHGTGYFAITDRVETTSQVYEPMLFPTVGNFIAPRLPDSTSSVMSVAVQTHSVVETELFGGSTVFQPEVINTVYVKPSMVYTSSVVFVPEVSSIGDIQPSLIPPSNFIFRPELRQQRSYPVRMKQPGVNGELTMVDLSPYQSYLDMGTAFIPSQARRGEVFGTVSSYTVSDEAMFSGVYYDGFYIYNEALTLDGVSNIYLSITGGRSYEVVDTLGSHTVYEATPFLSEVNPAIVDEFRLGGKSRTSLFGQVKISLMVSPTRDLVKFNRDGSSPFLNLQRQTFTPANQRIKIPSLQRGEYWGVYVRVETEFSPDIPYEVDYSFVNLSYTRGNFRESYPGQVRNTDGTMTSQLLPSVYFKFTTGYDAVVKDIEKSVDKLYRRYPPYLLHYEDIT